jgi:hypothetical protein
VCFGSKCVTYLRQARRRLDVANRREAVIAKSRPRMSQLGLEDIRASNIPGAQRSTLRHPGFAHVFNDPRASLQENWIVRLGGVSIAPEGEPRIEG